MPKTISISQEGLRPGTEYNSVKMRMMKNAYAMLFVFRDQRLSWLTWTTTVKLRGGRNSEFTLTQVIWSSLLVDRILVLVNNGLCVHAQPMELLTKLQTSRLVLVTVVTLIRMYWLWLELQWERETSSSILNGMVKSLELLLSKSSLVRNLAYADQAEYVTITVITFQSPWLFLIIETPEP
jgi:hypothetical protein